MEDLRGLSLTGLAVDVHRWTLRVVPLLDLLNLSWIILSSLLT